MDRQPYDSDLSDRQWAAIKDIVPANKPGGRPACYERREIVNGILYVLDNGNKWKSLPHDFPHWKTVFNYFSEWKGKGIWQRVRLALTRQERREQGRLESPSIGIIDSQSVKTQGSGSKRGYDGNKKVKGRKRHILTDTLGLVLAVTVTAANVADSTAAVDLLSQPELKRDYPRLRVIRADGAYKGERLEKAAQAIGCRMEVIERDKGQKGFEPVPGRWVVERSFAWQNNNRRLSKDYEHSPSTTEAFVNLSASKTLLNRIQ